MPMYNPPAASSAGGIASYTWATKPAAASAGAGALIRVADVGVGVGGSFWTSDGTNWRPLNGTALLKQFYGSSASPAIVYTGGTGGVQLAMPGGNLLLPAGMLVPGGTLRFNGAVRRRGANAGSNIRFCIGTGQAYDTGSRVFNLNFSGDGQATAIDFAVSLVNSTTLMSTTYSTRNGLSGSFQDFSFNVNAASDMWFTLDVGTANASDFLDVVGMTVELRQ